MPTNRRGIGRDGTAGCAPHEGGGTRRPAGGRIVTGKSAGIPGSRTQGDRDLQVGVGVDEAQPLRPVEDGADATAPGRYDLRLVARARLGCGAVLQHGADQGQPPGAGDAPLEVGQLSDQIGEGVGGGGLGPGVRGGLERVGGQAGLVPPPAVQGLAGGAGFLGDRGDGHGLVPERGQVPMGDLEHPGVDAGVAGAPAVTAPG